MWRLVPVSGFPFVSLAPWMAMASMQLAIALGTTTVSAQGDGFSSDEFGLDEFGSDEFGGEGEFEPDPDPDPGDAQAPPASPAPLEDSGASTSSGTGNEAAPEAAQRAAEGGEFDEAFDAGAVPQTSGLNETRESGPDSDGDGEPEGDDASTEVDAPPPSLREQAFRYANTLYGATGGFRVIDASPAYPSTFRVQLATEFFFANSFLNNGDSNDRLGGILSLSYGLHEYVEAYASVAAYGNFNNTEDPELFQVLGDTVIGAKGGVAVLPWLAVGGDLSLSLLNTVGDIGVVLGGTSVGIRGNLTADFRRFDTGTPGGIPLVARLNLQYYFDNSANLVEDVEVARYNALPPEDRRPFGDETRNLVTRVERFALNINRTDFFNIGVGLEAPLQVADDFYVHPILEWTWRIPVNRQAYDCLFISDPAGGSDPAPSEDGCLQRQGIGSFPMRLTAGVRVLPPVRGLSVFAGADIGLTGTSTFVRELAATAPYNVMVGLGYAYDTNPEAPSPVVQQVERRVEIPSTLGGRIIGTVIEDGVGIPVSDAVVQFDDPALTRLVTSENGGFVSYPFPPGDVGYTVDHEHFEQARCVATVPSSGEDVTASCALPASPRSGSVAGHVVTVDGEPLSATLALTGPVEQNVSTDSSGAFELSRLEAGNYSLKVEAEGYLLRVQSVTVERHAITDLRLELVAKPRRPLVRLRPRALQLRRRINFADNGDEISPSSFPVLAEVADVLIRHPEVQRVEIQGHTDDRGGYQANLRLSERRARAVRDWLVHHGVDASRLEAKGMGSARPIVPNITPANRARNRRVQFVVVERSDRP